MATNDMPTALLEEEILKQDDEEEEKDVNTILISLVKEKSFIYDVKDPRHKDRNLLEKTWVKIASQIDMTVEDTKTKWQRLRNNFGKAIERRQKTPRSGSAATKLQKPWMYEADMEFIRSHLNCHRPPSSSLKRDMNSTTMSENSLFQSSQPSFPSLTLTAVDSDNGSMSDSISVENSKEHGQEYRTVPTHTPKSKRLDVNELDSAVISFILKNAAAKEEEHPAVGWFKSLLPVFNTLSPIEQLEFQSNMTLELRRYLLAKGQQHGVHE